MSGVGEHDFFELSFVDYRDMRNYPDSIEVPKHLVLRIGEPGLYVVTEPLVWAWRHPDVAPRDVVFTGGVTIVSGRFRDVVEPRLGPYDEVQWIPADLQVAEGDRVPYWLPHLPVHHDVLSDVGTEWQSGGVPMRYAYSRTKLAGHAFTAQTTRPYTYDSPSRGPVLMGTSADVTKWVVAAPVIDALRSADVTGARIVPARVLVE